MRGIDGVVGDNGEAGDTGPAGPVGEPGEPGIEGQKGPTGHDGQPVRHYCLKTDFIMLCYFREEMEIQAHQASLEQEDQLLVYLWHKTLYMILGSYRDLLEQ